ncbi:acetamidase/formamidase family protein [Peribacillus sp. SCS-37]|uniref:acetamidase/formamidase family protein n=1 Tax=Paraperibacillus esterisolvens TaxID=3115296 RepID=UPI00390629BA
MIQTLQKEKLIYSFSKNHEPAIKLAAGSRIFIETYDCYRNQLKRPEDLYHLKPEEINPVTGPIYIESAEPGDILKVEIHRLQIAGEGVMTVRPGKGVLGHLVKDPEMKVIPISGNKALFNDRIHLPLNPMIGVIGVAPAGKAVPAGTPGSHGGNLDTLSIKEGAVLYLPVFTEGALFGLGDMHAAMGDGEVGISGIETSGTAEVSLHIIKKQPLAGPIVKNECSFSTLASAPTLHKAAHKAAEAMVDFLLPFSGLTQSELIMLCSAAGRLQISQAVNPLATVRFTMGTVPHFPEL